MRTTFGKRFIATGLIAALGVNLITATAFAGPGNDRGHDRSYGRDDGRGRDSARGRGRERGRGYHDARSAQPNGRHGHDRGRAWNQPRQAGKQAHKQAQKGRGGKTHAAQRHGPSRGERYRAPVKVVRKPVVVKKTMVVRQPAPAHRKAAHKKARHKQVVHKQVVYKAPPARKGHGHGHYGAPPTRVIVVPERRHYRNVWVVRDYGHRYRGYGHHHHDHDAYKWLAFTAVTVALINNLTEYQQRAYEDAQIRATTAPVGETIHWNEAGAYGTVTTTREGTSSLNRYCREFQKTVTIGGRTEQAYGTACMQPDGAWEVVSNGGY